MTSARKACWGVLLALLLLSIGCGAHFDGVLLQKPGVAYRVGRLDPRYRRVRVDTNDLAFYKPGAGSIAVNATCKDYDDVPAAVLLNHLLFGTTHRTFVRDEELNLDGRSARHAVVDAELDGVPVRLDIYVLTRAPCVFDLSYVSERSAPAQAEFAGFARAFHIVEVRRE